MYYGWGLDPIAVMLLIPAMIFAFYAQHRVQSTWKKYSRVATNRGYSGAQVARWILDDAGLRDIPVEMTPGHLSDHYDPRTRVVRLSRDVFHGTSVASLGVAAHETGHALQHQQQYIPLNIRNHIFPVARFGSTLAFPVFLMGFIFSSGGSTLMDIGIYLFAATVAFQLVTLPVEFDASRRAIRLLADKGFLDRDEIPRTKTVLNAAALTYVAAATVSLVHLLRLILLRGSRD